MKNIYFDLKELGGHFDYVAKENNRITLQLSALEKKFKPLRDGIEELTTEHIKTITDDLGFITWWKMPEVEDKELDELKGLFKNLAPCNKDVICKLYDLLKNIEAP